MLTVITEVLSLTWELKASVNVSITKSYCLPCSLGAGITRMSSRDVNTEVFKLLGDDINIGVVMLV